jgi:serine-type D-Ala-D-Ala carboxypeptidase (penicillin-binding protein 5/6)
MRRLFVPLAVLAMLAVSPAGAAAAGATPPPTPVPVPCSTPSGVCLSPSPFPTVLHTPAPSTEPPAVEAAAAVLEDLRTGQVLFARDPDGEHSLASTTKIMTALLVLRRAASSDVVTVGADAAEEGRSGAGFSELGLRDGERITVGRLLDALMLQSSNDAAIALADHVSGSVAAFVADMNRVAKGMGLRHTVFFSPNGLDDRGHSTALEMAAVTRAAMALPDFRRIVDSRFATIPAPSGPPRRVQNRNVLLWLYRGATGVKTGYTGRAGFCLVATADRSGRDLVAVVLGAPSTEASFDDAAVLLDYGFTGWRQVTLVRAGQDFPPVPVGTQRLPVEVPRALERLLPTDVARTLRHEVRILPGIRTPLAPRERVGTVTYRAGGRRIGTAPLVVAGAPVGERSSSGGTPWWVRGLGSVAGFTFRTFLHLFG